MGIIRKHYKGETECNETPEGFEEPKKNDEYYKNKSRYYKKLTRQYKNENYDLLKKLDKLEKLNKQINLELLQEIEKNIILDIEKL